MADSSCSYDCSNQPSKIQGEPDIAGIGVILGFLITAYLVAAILVGYYLLAFDPTLDPFRHHGAFQPEKSRPNPVDVSLLWGARTLLRKLGIDLVSAGQGFKGGKLEAAFNSCVLSLSDIQLITGISILTSGYYGLRCGMSVYHWQLVAYMAWLSTSTHLAALTFLRNYLFQNPAKRLTRLILMACLVVMLASAMGPVTLFDAGTPASYAICYYTGDYESDSPDPSGIFSILIIFFSFVVRLIKAHQTSSRIISRRLMRKATHSVLRVLRKLSFSSRKSRRSRQIWHMIIVQPLAAAYVAILLYIDFYLSLSSEVYWVIVSMAWSTRNLVLTRSFGPVAENSWSFGQIIALVLLLGPLLTIFEYVLDYRLTKRDLSPGEYSVNEDDFNVEFMNPKYYAG